MVKKAGSGGSKKHGRNKVSCQLYKSKKTREQNKIKKWSKMIKKLSPDNNMRKELERNIQRIESELYK